MAEKRTPRDLETRDKDARPESWAPPSVLPDPEPADGWVFRWVRTSMVGTPDNTNVSQRFREGWEPVKREEHPEFVYIVGDHGSEWEKRGAIEVGGLILCKAAEESMEARNKYYRDMAEQQMAAIDNTLMANNDPRMPLLKPERKTNRSFGGMG